MDTNEKETEKKNINRRNFLKKLAAGAVFTVPTIQSLSLLDSDDDRDKFGWWWTGHHHHHHKPPIEPPVPSK